NHLPPTVGPSARGQAWVDFADLLLQLTNAGLNWLNDIKQQKRFDEDFKKHAAAINARDPSLGVLVVVYYQVFEPVGSQNESRLQPGPQYSHMETYFAFTPDEARQQWRHSTSTRPTGAKSQNVWYAPARPAGVQALQTPFPRLRLATFVPGQEK